MSEFLLELLCEEIPARMQPQAVADLKEHLSKRLQGQSITFEQITTYITPRRLTAVVTGMATETRASVEEKRGPKVGAPEAALQGFLKGAGVSQSECSMRDGYWYAQIIIPARPVTQILPVLIKDIICNFSWPKTMRWAGSQLPWVRPLRNILTLLDGQPLVFAYPELGITTGDTTVGHRFLAPHEFTVNSFADYQAKLKYSYVILDHSERQELIEKGLQALGAAHDVVLQPDAKLLEEVAGLVEYPQPLLGQIESQFMTLPAAVLRTSMRVHQKYFTFNDRQGKIAPYFGLVANTIPNDDGKIMRQGYERVLRARLSDAAFFYEQDKAIPLEKQLGKLDNIIFHAKLGTLAQRVERLQKLVDSTLAKRAARLCKADLVTSMVGEFPELQGIMGAEYAIAQGEDEDVARAIAEHYQPQGPEGICPTNPVAVELASAEKIDTLTGFFAIAEKPTGSKDPYALRRAALGIIRLIRENKLQHFSLTSKISQAADLYDAQGVESPDNIVREVSDFIYDRLGHVLKAEGMRADCIAAGRAVVNQEASLLSVIECIKTLNSYLDSESGQALQTAFRRAIGILTQAKTTPLAVDTSQFIAPAERVLYDQLQDIANKAPVMAANLKFVDMIDLLAQLRPTVDAFFELKINDDNEVIRHNRLALLSELITRTTTIADFTLIEG